jgi:type I restriction enzyme S subunit
MIFVKAGEFGIESPAVREWTTDPLKIARDGDTLICVVGATAGKINRSRFECAIGRSVASVRSTSIELNQDYLHSFLKTKILELRNRSQGAAQAVITREMLQNIDIPLPPLAEQNRIAEQLDTADRIMRLREQAIAKLNDLVQSVFVERFIQKKIYPIVILSEISKTSSGGTPNRNVSDYYSGNIPWVKSGELHSDLILSTEESISDMGLCNSSAKIMPVGTVLLAMYGATVGAVSILGIEAATNQAICCIKVDSSKMLPEFLVSFLKYHKKQIISRAVGGAQPNINQNIVREIRLPAPPIAKQIEFVSFLKELRNEQNMFSISSKKMSQLQMSLQYQSFAVN